MDNQWEQSMLVKLRGIADEVAKAGAVELEKQLKENLSRKSGTPSRPGEYPAKQSGRLVESIKRTRRRVGNKVEYEVSVSTEYAKILEQKRPYFRRTISESSGEIWEAMRRQAKRRGIKWEG